jgi:hypothetical protein
MKYLRINVSSLFELYDFPHPEFIKTGIKEVENSVFPSLVVFVPFREELKKAFMGVIEKDFKDLLEKLKEVDKQYDKTV